MYRKLFSGLFLAACIAITVNAEPALIDGQSAYYNSLKKCTPAKFEYDALLMGYKNTKEIVGQEDGKCVIKEEINPEMTLVCRIPMRILSKYADESFRLVKESYKGPAKSEYVDKIQSDPKYCNIEVKP